MPLPREVPTWGEWAKVFQDPAVWRGAVRDICRRHRLANRGNVRPGFPGTGAVFTVDERYVVKLFPPMVAGDCEREQECLELLAGRSEVPAPRLLAAGVYRDAIDWPYLVIGFCPGQALRDVFDRLPPPARLEVAREVARMLGVVHATPLDRAQVLATGPEAWPRFITERRRACPDEHRRQGVLGAALCDELPGYLVAALGPAAGPPRLLNGDLTEDHLLLVERGGRWRVSGIIDWGDVEAGDTGYEWPALWLAMFRQDVTMMRAFMAEYDPALRMDGAWRRGAMAYTLLHRFGPAMVHYILACLKPARMPEHLAGLEELLWPGELERPEAGC